MWFSAVLSSCLFLTAVFLVTLVASGFKRLQTVAHIPLEHLPILSLFFTHCHEVATVVGLVLQVQRKRCQLKQTHRTKYHPFYWCNIMLQNPSVPVSWVCRGFQQAHDVSLALPLSWLLVLCQSLGGLDTPHCRSLSWEITHRELQEPTCMETHVHLLYTTDMHKNMSAHTFKKIPMKIKNAKHSLSLLLHVLIKI